MTPSTVLANLRADAVFYQLDGLVEQCDAVTKPHADECSPSRYLILGSQYKHAEIEDIETQLAAAILSKAWKTRVGQDVLEKEPLAHMERPGARTGFAALREVAAIERFVGSQFDEYQSGAWSLVGWNIRKMVGTWEVSSQLMVVLEHVRR
ncbi:hypothetical protein RSAG8_12567, partial [Rhizoctonia solani AG-8 WAC10335]